MPAESSSDVKFEIGHVLFIDIVGYCQKKENWLSLMRRSKRTDSPAPK